VKARLHGAQQVLRPAWMQCAQRLPRMILIDPGAIQQQGGEGEFQTASRREKRIASGVGQMVG